MKLQALLVLCITILLVLIFLVFSKSENKIEFSGRIENTCIQHPPNYGCGFPDPGITKENDKLVILNERHWGAQISWDLGFKNMARINGFNSEISLDCFNLDCSENQGSASGELLIEFNDKALKGRYETDIINGSIFGTFTINSGFGKLDKAIGSGILIVTEKDGLISGDLLI